MLQKKVCVLGAFGVGKTSLVRRFVQSIFSDAYLTTVGVKIDKKTVDLSPQQQVTLVLWDVAGEDDSNAIRMSYVRGAAGYFLVVDGTREETLRVAESIHLRVNAEVGPLPFLLLLNKADLVTEWELPHPPGGELIAAAAGVVRTSAKSGDGVEDAFRELASRITR